LTLPQALYDDPVKNMLYDEARNYIGYRKEYFKVNSSDCKMEQSDFLVMPMYGDELSAELDLTEEQEVFMGDPVVYKITLRNKGPEPFNVTFNEEGISHRRISFDPPSLTVPSASTANVFFTIDTRDLELGSAKAKLFVITKALPDITLLARFKLKAAGAIAQRQFDLFNEINSLEDDFDRKISNGTYDINDISRVRSYISSTRNLVTTGYLGPAGDEMPKVRAEIDAMKMLAPLPEPVEEVVIIPDLPDESRFQETELTAASFEQFLMRYAWLIVLIILIFGAAISYVTYKGFYVPNSHMTKDARYVSDIEVRISLKLRNNSMRRLDKVVLYEPIPHGFTLQSRFTSRDKSIPFTEERTTEGIGYRMDLSVIDPNSTIEIQYVLQKPKVVFGQISVPPSTLNYTFRGKPVTLNSNIPVLGA